jgi:CDP-diacylglycerol--glycerol-3-phosphate 3-phosphatidyltransferase
VSKYKNLPNFLTLLRILIIPAIISSFYFDDTVLKHRISSFLFLLASITDFLDGYVARKYNLESNLGKMLDPIADKILVTSILLMLVKFNKVPEIPCILIVSREFMVSGIREFLAKIKFSIPVSKLAKVKTFLQMVAIFALLLGSKGSSITFCDDLGLGLLWTAAIMTIFTSLSYLRRILNHFR